MEKNNLIELLEKLFGVKPPKRPMTVLQIKQVLATYLTVDISTINEELLMQALRETSCAEARIRTRGSIAVTWQFILCPVQKPSARNLLKANKRKWRSKSVVESLKLKAS